MTTEMDRRVQTGTSAGAAVLGLGGCLDYEVTWDAAALETLASRHGITMGDLDRGGVLRDERELVCSILAFMRDGVGGERAVARPDVIEDVSAQFGRRVTLGGTSVRAALAMSRIGVPSTLHLVSIDDQVRDLLPRDVDWICSGSGDSLNPHLIIQFPRGARVRLADGEVVAPAANRLIYVSDRPNTEMRIHPALGDMLRAARLFLISGFNAMSDEAALRDRLRSMREAVDNLPEHGLVVFEDAGYHVPRFADIVVEEIADRVDVYGMNEDELQSRVGTSIDLHDEHAVASALRAVREQIPHPTIVVHTSAWALAFGPGAAGMGEALDEGIALAGARYMLGDSLDAAGYAEVAALPRQAAGARFANRLESLLGDSVVCRPALDLATETPTTIGLGDTFVGGLVAGLLRRGTARTQVLSANQPPARFYAGGSQIARFRGSQSSEPHTPEDWVGSATTLFGEESLGLTRLPDGVLLRDAIERDPVGWLGTAHLRAFGSDPALLVKLLDAGQRLPVHAHPDQEFAARHLGLAHGKTEAWIFLTAAAVHLGWTRDIGEEELATWVRDQDVEAMLGATHVLDVSPGDAVLVPAGTPHAIGAGALLVELQEPTDLSILMEWDGFAIDGAAKGHLDLGFEVALAAVGREASTAQQIESLRTATSATEGDLLPTAAPFFRAERLRAPRSMDPGFSILVCTAGRATLTSASGETVSLSRGTTAITAHASGDWTVDASGDFEVVRCRPPAPSAESVDAVLP